MTIDDLIKFFDNVSDAEVALPKSSIMVNAVTITAQEGDLDKLELFVDAYRNATVRLRPDKNPEDMRKISHSNVATLAYLADYPSQMMLLSVGPNKAYDRPETHGIAMNAMKAVFERKGINIRESLDDEPESHERCSRYSEN